MSSGKESEGDNNGGSKEIGVQKDNTKEKVTYQPLNLRLTITPELLERITSAVDPKDRQNLRTSSPTPEKPNQQVSTLNPLIGFTMALACTPLGEGSVSYIMTTCVGEEQGKGSFQIMNQLGNAMRQSAFMAYRVAQRIMFEKEPENLFFKNSKLCLYARGDGASAGCTMVTSMLSLAMKKPMRMNLAMTGGITLIGSILPIGGVRQKTIAAKRSQVKMIIFPEGNRRDFEELEDNVKEGLDARFVNEYNQIFELAFGYDQEVSTLQSCGEKIHGQTPIGVAMALAYTSMGGSTAYIETTIVEGQGSYQVTGTVQVGLVMKVSAVIAYKVAKRIMLEKEPLNPFFRNFKLRLHVHGGDMPKDGQSAGCTMITSMLSLAMKKPVRKNLAMTGGITTTGGILRIAGVREKTIAAKRSQVKMIIFPEANRGEFEELEENVKEGLDAHFVSDYN